MNIFKSHKNNVKNANSAEYDFPLNLEALNKWTIPKFSYKDVYNIGIFDNIRNRHIVKTIEESVSMDGEEKTIQLISEDDIHRYHKQNYKFLHIGLVQIAFKPLTLQGLPESFIAVLRDARNLNWKQSLMGVMQTSLACGPVYFDVKPNLTISLSDPNILHALTLYVKAHNYDYMPESEVICICYRIYYRVLDTMNPNCRMIDNQNKNQTVIIETNLARSSIITRKPIRWEEIDFPETWKLEKTVPVYHRPEHSLAQIIQTSEGDIQLQFEKPKISRSISSRNTNQYYISPFDTHRASTSGRIEDLYKVTTPSQMSDDINETNEISKIRIGKSQIPIGISEDQIPDPTPSEMGFNGI